MAAAINPIRADRHEYRVTMASPSSNPERFGTIARGQRASGAPPGAPTLHAVQQDHISVKLASMRHLASQLGRGTRLKSASSQRKP